MVEDDAAPARNWMQNDEIYRLIVDSLPDGLGVCDAEGRLVYVNDRFCAMLGYSREEIVGRPCADFLDGANRERLELEFSRRRQGDNSSYEIEAITRDGDRITTLQMPRGLFDAEGRFVGSYAVVSDIAERKRAERALLESEARYHSLFEDVPVGLYRTTPAGVMLDANSTLVKILGFPDVQALLKAHVGDLYQDPEDRRRWQRILVGASTAQSFEAPWRTLRTATGRRRRCGRARSASARWCRTPRISSASSTRRGSCATRAPRTTGCWAPARSSTWATACRSWSTRKTARCWRTP